MLKFLSGLGVSLVVLATSAYAQSAYAASASIVITQIQAGGVGDVTQERVVLYNNSPTPVDITNWCLRNKHDTIFACFNNPGGGMMLPAYSYAIAGSSTFANALGLNNLTVVYEPINQTSGSITSGSDTISLVDQYANIIDSHSWSTSLSAGMVLLRNPGAMYPLTYPDNDQSGDWHVQENEFIPNDQVERYTFEGGPEDMCTNIEGIQTYIPNDHHRDESGFCTLVIPPLILTEILPNATGSDVGKEFIEIYNDSEEAIDLSRFMLWVGPNFESVFTFPQGAVIQPQSYIAFLNSDISFSLLNTSSRVQITTDSGTIVSEAPSYSDPKDDEAWALIDGLWQYTSPTPGTENSPTLTPILSTMVTTSSLKPCADNQYRSPETNRCRLIAAAPTQTPCKDNQYRSEETGRCRQIAITSDEPTPCKEGQERNPETNRCRTIKIMETADYGVLGTQTKKSGNGWIWWVIGLLILAVLTYAVWEWRVELRKLFKRIRPVVRIRK